MENALEGLCLSENAHEELHTQRHIPKTTKKKKKNKKKQQQKTPTTTTINK